MKKKDMTPKQAQQYLATVKTKVYQIHIEVTDSEAGKKIMDKFASLLIECKHEFPLDYINGWGGCEEDIPK